MQIKPGSSYTWPWFQSLSKFILINCLIFYLQEFELVCYINGEEELKQEVNSGNYGQPQLVSQEIKVLCKTLTNSELNLSQHMPPPIWHGLCCQGDGMGF